MAMSMKAWRKAKDLTQSEMAERLGIHVNTYINWESNPQNISISNCICIASVLGVSFNDIIFLPSKSTKM